MNSDKKQKKNLYVPDDELLAYSKSKNETDAADSLHSEVLPEDSGTAEVWTDIGETVDTTADEGSIGIADEAENGETEIKDSKNSKLSKKDSKSGNRFVRILRAVFPLKSDSKKTIIIKCVAIVAAIALIVSATYLSVYFIDLGQQDAKIDNIRNSYELNRDDYSKNEDNQFSKFDYLKKQNPDIVGWITINNTEVNNPVYQTDNNEYYIDHDMDKQANSYGALFLDYRCDINPMSLSRNQIIYGHNMRYGAMFGTLKSYRELDFYKQNPVIYFDSLYEQRVYKIFAIMVVNDAEDDTFGYTYTAYRNAFTSDTDFMQWIDRSRQRSLIDTTVDVNAEDEILTLSTCCYDYTNARLVILGRLVRDGESEEVNTTDAVINSDVIYSKEYYEKKGMSIPKIETSESVTSK